MRKLTPKQEKFCTEYLRTSNKTRAYKEAYSTSRMKPETINVKASELFSNGKVSVRVRELQKELEGKELYTLEESIKKDLNLIRRYEEALDILADDSASGKVVEVAIRTIKYIGSNGYGSAQDRIAKKQGFYEKDNDQKTVPPVQNILNLGMGTAPDEESENEII